MDYSYLIELNNVTLEDCISNYTMKNMAVELNDGQVIGFVKESEQIF